MNGALMDRVNFKFDPLVVNRFTKTPPPAPLKVTNEGVKIYNSKIPENYVDHRSEMQMKHILDENSPYGCLYPLKSSCSPLYNEYRHFRSIFTSYRRLLTVTHHQSKKHRFCRFWAKIVKICVFSIDVQ